MVKGGKHAAVQLDSSSALCLPVQVFVLFLHKLLLKTIYLEESFEMINASIYFLSRLLMIFCH